MEKAAVWRIFETVEGLRPTSARTDPAWEEEFVSERSAAGHHPAEDGAKGETWTYFPHDHARSRIGRWGEGGIGRVDGFALRPKRGETRTVRPIRPAADRVRTGSPP